MSLFLCASRAPRIALSLSSSATTSSPAVRSAPQASWAWEKGGVLKGSEWPVPPCTNSSLSSQEPRTGAMEMGRALTHPQAAGRGDEGMKRDEGVAGEKEQRSGEQRHTRGEAQSGDSIRTGSWLVAPLPHITGGWVTRQEGPGGLTEKETGLCGPKPASKFPESWRRGRPRWLRL